MSPLRLFGAKGAQNGQLRKLGLQIRSFSVEIGLQTFAVLWIPFSAKACKFQPAELVTVCLRFVTACFWVEKVRKSGPVPELRSTSFFAGFFAARQPAEEKALKMVNSEKSVFRVRRQVGCLSLKFRSFSVESRSLRLSPLRHRSLWGQKVRKSGQVPKRTSLLASLSQ